MVFFEKSVSDVRSQTEYKMTFWRIVAYLFFPFILLVAVVKILWYISPIKWFKLVFFVLHLVSFPLQLRLYYFHFPCRLQRPHFWYLRPQGLDVDSILKITTVLTYVNQMCWFISTAFAVRIFMELNAWDVVHKCSFFDYPSNNFVYKLIAGYIILVSKQMTETDLDIVDYLDSFTYVENM